MLCAWSRSCASGPISSAELRRRDDDDRGLMERTFQVYDALFAHPRFIARVRHNRPVKAA